MRDITFGQYIPTNSVLHRLDPRMKILGTILAIVMVFLCGNFINLFLVVAFVLTIIKLTNIPIKLYLKSIKAVIFVIVVTSVLNIFYGTGEPIFQLGFMTITLNGIFNSIFIACRIMLLVIVSSVLTFTTSPTDLTDAIGRLLKPLSKLHINVYDIAMMMTIALRFIPTLIEETDKIMNAQKARGADLESGSFIQRAKALIPILVPLFISAFRRAYDLAMAMECRCYQSGMPRSRMKVLKFTKNDILASFSLALIFIAVILINIFAII